MTLSRLASCRLQRIVNHQVIDSFPEYFPELACLRGLVFLGPNDILIRTCTPYEYIHVNVPRRLCYPIHLVTDYFRMLYRCEIEKASPYGMAGVLAEFYKSDYLVYDVHVLDSYEYWFLLPTNQSGFRNPYIVSLARDYVRRVFPGLPAFTVYTISPLILHHEKTQWIQAFNHRPVEYKWIPMETTPEGFFAFSEWDTDNFLYLSTYYPRNGYLSYYAPYITGDDKEYPAIMVLSTHTDTARFLDMRGFPLESLEDDTVYGSIYASETDVAAAFLLHDMETDTFQLHHVKFA